MTVGFAQAQALPTLHYRDEEREAQRVDELRRDARRRQEAAVAAQDEQADERKVRDSGCAEHKAGCIAQPVADSVLFAQALNPRDKGFRFHAAVPQGARLDYQKQPQSRVSTDNQAYAGRAKPRKGGLLKKIDGMLSCFFPPMLELCPGFWTALPCIVARRTDGRVLNCSVSKERTWCRPFADVGKRSKQSGRAAKVSVEGRGL